VDRRRDRNRRGDWRDDRQTLRWEYIGIAIDAGIGGLDSSLIHTGVGPGL
jgi:hypothetical protein